MALNVKPLGDRVLVDPQEEREIKKGGIIIPDSAKEKPQKAKIIRTGPGRLDKDGKSLGVDVGDGDIILFGKYSGAEVKVDGEEYLILREDEILAVLG